MCDKYILHEKQTFSDNILFFCKQPSSSSEAAKLLVASGHVVSKGFIGFSNEASYVPASEIFDDAEASLDAEFRLVLRKLSKRDTVTKVKVTCSSVY